jgi:hypothetical protein
MAENRGPEPDDLRRSAALEHDGTISFLALAIQISRIGQPSILHRWWTLGVALRAKVAAR